jgi:diguanylate cyclase (GGDEF)-like protein
MAVSRMHRLLDLWLGVEPAQRLRLRQTSLAMALMGLCTPLLHYAVSIGHAPQGRLVWAWTAVSLGGMALVYAAIRSGWSRRFADPSLTSLQIAFAIGCGAAGYALAGPMRGAVFPVLTLILMFGMFQLRARSAYTLSLFALALFGVVMALMATWRPAAYPPAVEIGHFLMLACMLPAIAVLTARLSRIRHRLSQQREELARALAQLEAIATHDELTGLPNRRQMQALMDQELLRSLRHPHDFCIALLDLDRFKQINDTHGHAAGDAVLRAVARAGQAALRATDVLARWGGEEFVVLMPDTAMPPALAGMQRLRQQIEALRIDSGGETITVTTSIGLTGHRRGDTLAQTLKRADQLLYQAKHEGRNRVNSDAAG